VAVISSLSLPILSRQQGLWSRLIATTSQLCSLIEQRLHLALAVMIYLRAIGESMVVYYLEEYGKEGDGI